jgi:hypothetical protein
VAGGAITLLLTIVTDNTLAAHGVLPSAGRPMFDTGPLVLMTVYRAVFATLGCHLAARIAPERTPRLRYALALGALLFVIAAIGARSLWGQVPLWYSLVGIAMTLPCAIVGGATAVRVLERRGAR